jgi:hypothetical protein
VNIDLPRMIWLAAFCRLLIASPLHVADALPWVTSAWLPSLSISCSSRSSSFQKSAGSVRHVDGGQQLLQVALQLRPGPGIARCAGPGLVRAFFSASSIRSTSFCGTSSGG